MCQCDPGFGGADCSYRTCRAEGASVNCSGVGHCSVPLGNVCLCPPGRGGAHCSQDACPAGCVAPRGHCLQGKCHCAVGWSGPECETPTCDKACSGHGVCTLAGCRCDDGWSGQDCSQRQCPQNCSSSLGQGRCHNGRCVCAAGFTGRLCNATCGADESDPSKPLCSGRGVCTSRRQCQCEPGYTGEWCERRTCLMGCSGRGLCHDGRCVCAVGFGGPDCAMTTVPSPRDCSTGCVHICASQCAKAAAHADSNEPDLYSSAGATGDCFTTCRRKCANACRSSSGQRGHWVVQKNHLLGSAGLLGPYQSEQQGKWEAPTIDYTWALAATAALGMRVPTAAALPEFDRWSARK